MLFRSIVLYIPRPLFTPDFLPIFFHRISPFFSFVTVPSFCFTFFVVCVSSNDFVTSSFRLLYFVCLLLPSLFTLLSPPFCLSTLYIPPFCLYLVYCYTFYDIHLFDTTRNANFYDTIQIVPVSPCSLCNPFDLSLPDLPRRRRPSLSSTHCTVHHHHRAQNTVSDRFTFRSSSVIRQEHWPLPETTHSLDLGLESTTSRKPTLVASSDGFKVRLRTVQ